MCAEAHCTEVRVFHFAAEALSNNTDWVRLTG